MMHDPGWLGMGGMGYSWPLVVLIVGVVVIGVWLFTRARSRRSR